MSLSEEEKGLNKAVEQKPGKRKISVVKDNYTTTHSSFEEDSPDDEIFSDPCSDRKLVLMEPNNQIRELQTIIWNRDTQRTDYIFYADRLIRLVIEEGLNQLPFEECSVTTHTGAKYHGCTFYKGICGVSIVRSGEAMEKALRECCRGIRIGKLLMTKDEDTNERSIIYARFPQDVYNRKVLLMYPLLPSGGNVVLGVETLLEYGVDEENIYILTLFCSSKGIESLFSKHPNVSLLTTEIRDEVPTHFGEKYFGTE